MFRTNKNLNETHSILLANFLLVLCNATVIIVMYDVTDFLYWSLIYVSIKHSCRVNILQNRNKASDTWIIIFFETLDHNIQCKQERPTPYAIYMYILGTKMHSSISFLVIQIELFKPLTSSLWDFEQTLFWFYAPLVFLEKWCSSH